MRIVGHSDVRRWWIVVLCMCHEQRVRRGFLLLLQSSLFGEGGNIYNMQAGGPRPGMHGTWRCQRRASCFRASCCFVVVGDNTVVGWVAFCGAGGFQQSGRHPPLGMNSYQVQGGDSWGKGHTVCFGVGVRWLWCGSRGPGSS